MKLVIFGVQGYALGTYMAIKEMYPVRNNIAGHMSYRPQHKAMEEYYKEIRRDGRL